MTTNKNTTELLSPAGTWEALVAAVQNGADAVYLGGTVYSARAGAGNFDNESLIRAVKYCHVRGVKVLVTLNTLIKQTEFEKAAEFAGFLNDAGVDAIIIQDLGLASYIMRTMPEIRLNASTQMTVHSVAGAKKLEQLGFKRVVLSRELSREQIRKIKEQTSLELEIFVHGAICCSYSGQCLFSSFLGGRSGNRGRCAQPCRLPYELKNGDKSVRKGYLLSPKDMCLLPYMGEIRQMGINSLKIEGRLKRPEYVAAVTRIYRKYLDTPAKPSKNDMDMLLSAFNRSGFTDGYYTGNTGSSMMSFNSPSNVSEEKFESDIKKTFSEGANFRRINVVGKCMMLHGRAMEMTLTDCDGNSVTAFGPVPDEAVNAPLGYDRAYAQLSKFGAVPFLLTELTLDMDDGLSVAISDINALRRSVCDMLIQQRAKIEGKSTEASSSGVIVSAEHEKIELSVEVRTLEQARAVLELSPDRVFVPKPIADKLGSRVGKTQIVTKFGAIINNENEGIYKSLSTKGVMCSSIGAAYAVEGKHKIYSDYRLNIYNEESVAFCLDNGFERVTLSPELSIKDMAAMSKTVVGGCDVIVYGHIPLMTMKNCVIKSCGGSCTNGRGDFYLTDRKRERFPILCQSDSCTNLLLNSKPTYMADKLGDLMQIGAKKFTLMFTVERAEDCARICSEYMHAMMGEKIENSMGENNFTRAHFYHGVL